MARMELRSVVVAIVLMFACVTAGAALSGTVVLVSAPPSGGLENMPSYKPALSSDGRYVAFVSEADNLVADDTNGTFDVFVASSAGGGVERVSLDENGRQLAGGANIAAISGDGRFVAFASAGTSERTLYVRDRLAGVSTKVFEPVLGYGISLSFDGGRLAFVTAASLASADGGGTDVYVYDRASGGFLPASLPHGPSSDNGASVMPELTADGNQVMFSSERTDLIAGDSRTAGLVVRNLSTGVIQRVAVSDDGAVPDGYVLSPSLSADGRYVAFSSNATTLALDQPCANRVDGRCYDLFVRDRLLGTTTLVSRGTDGIQYPWESRDPRISGNGRYLVFRSDDGPAADPANAFNCSSTCWHFYIRDLTTGATTAMGYTVGNDVSGASAPSVSFLGDTIAFDADASITPNDTNTCQYGTQPTSCRDVYVARLATIPPPPDGNAARPSSGAPTTNVQPPTTPVQPPSIPLAGAGPTTPVPRAVARKGKTLAGSAANNTLAGSPFNDTLYGRAGADRLDGRSGDDRIYGGPGADRLTGGPGNDVLDGGPGSDTVRARDGRRDTVRCGTGNDTVTADAVDRISPDCEDVRQPHPL